MARAPRKAEILLEYQRYIESPPIRTSQMYQNACSSDGVTIESWRQTWIDNVTANKKRFGSFKERGVGQLFGLNRNKPAFIVGSGPSLARNGHDLKDRGDIPAISCLHNYHFFEDREIPIDYYVTLDAGEVVMEEVYEGGSKSPDEYWASTRGKKLIAFIGTNPKLFDLWQGEVYLFNAPVPDQKFLDHVKSLETFNTCVSNGGNVLGACLYIAKGIMGSNPIAFMGADFSFGYDKRFHGWDSKYDKKLGSVLQAIDVFGNKVLTWPSYANFKQWFDYIALTVPGLYINCSEGGTFGAYPDGNLMAIRQMGVLDFLEMYRLPEALKEHCLNPEVDTGQVKILF